MCIRRTELFSLGDPGISWSFLDVFRLRCLSLVSNTDGLIKLFESCGGCRCSCLCSGSCGCSCSVESCPGLFSPSGSLLCSVTSSAAADLPSLSPYCTDLTPNGRKPFLGCLHGFIKGSWCKIATSQDIWAIMCRTRREWTHV